MSDFPSILVIDDEKFIHDLVTEALSDFCNLLCVESGEDALTVVQSEQPDLILVDVAMPGMDGYETCRRFKEMESLVDVPVLFISGHDQIEDRLRGYEAGGADFVGKPFNLQELKAKADYLLNLAYQKKQIKEMASFATTTAMTAMSNMSELGALLESLKKFNACDTTPSLAAAIIEGLKAFDLHGVVQIRIPEEKLTLSDHGPATPLEESVIEHMTSMERIVHFKSRMSIHYEHVSLLISNMPVDDEERCGRLRDHLAMLIEAAEVRANSILSMQESRLRGAVIERTVARISDALREIDAEQRKSRVNARIAVDEMIDSVDKALLGVALSEEQESFLAGVVRQGIETILSSQTDEITLQNHLSKIIEELKSVLPHSKQKTE